MDTFLVKAADADNVKGIMLGRAFCLAAIVKSARATAQEYTTIMGELFKLLKVKEYLRQEPFIISYSMKSNFSTTHNAQL